jgi:hypothetical protein
VVQQAQTYFAGQSRYVGVYDTSRLAARAYIVVQDYLRSYRISHSITKDSPKEDLAQIFANARKAADDAVRDMLRQDGGQDTTNFHHYRPGGAASALANVEITIPGEVETTSPVAAVQDTAFPALPLAIDDQAKEPSVQTENEKAEGM